MRLAGGLRSTPRMAVAALCGLVVLSLFGISLLQGGLGDIGSDGDDVMRLVQIRDLLAGQGWFDLTQTRLGPEGGTAMHWSRLADLPVLVLTGLFGLFLPQDSALQWAYTVWPPLCVLGVLGGVYTGARRAAGAQDALFCLLLAAIMLAGHYRFMPGAIDHHNLQLALMALTLGLLLDPRRTGLRMAWAGVALALSVAIGGEVYVFAGVLCAFVALDWAIAGQAARKGAIGFGAGLAAGLELAFFTTVAPSAYTQVACDALSSVTLLAGMAGGLGLAAAAALAPEGSWRVRLAALGGVGVIVGVILAGNGPQCLSNPLDALSPEVHHLWLEQVNEARPALSPSPTFLQDAPFRLGILLVATGLCVLRLYQRRMVRTHALCLALLAAAIFLTLYQNRFFVFGHVFALLPLGLWIAETYRTGKARKEGSVAYLFALAVSLPVVWGLPGLLLAPQPGVGPAASANEACLGDGVYAGLNSLPEGRILASADFGPVLLLKTGHSVLNGNYHRNATGIGQAMNVLLSHPGDTQALLAGAGVDYVLACRYDSETRFLSAYDPDGFVARLNRGEVPDYLTPVPLPAGSSGAAKLYFFDRRGAPVSGEDSIS